MNRIVRLPKYLKIILLKIAFDNVKNACPLVFIILHGLPVQSFFVIMHFFKYALKKCLKWNRIKTNQYVSNNWTFAKTR